MSKLFPNAIKTFRQQARSAFRGSEVGKLLTEVEGMRGGRSVSRGNMRRLERTLQRMSNRGILDAMANSEAGGIASEISRYAKQGVQKTITDALMDALGPIGSVLKSMIRPSGRQMASVDRELEAAANLLQAFGWDVKRPSGRVGGTRPRGKKAERLMESIGFTTERPQRVDPGERPFFVRPERRGVHEGYITLKIGGRTRQYKQDDPILTGELIPVSSSNVHSIGFIFNHESPMKGTLQVRYLQSKRSGKGTGGGPLYYYSGVHPDVFVAFQAAASKGTFVWDRLRIRGTVSGHRYPYDLKGITAGYVPRKATRYGPNEYLIQRRVRGQDGNYYQSELDDERAGRVNRGAPEGMVPNRGTPNRGTPNRGR